MRVTVLTPLILLACSVPAIGESPSENASSAAPSNGELKMVVALFRHGVRAPLHDIDDPNKYGKNSWPTMSEWGVTRWGDLTPHGAALASALGRDYAQTYRKNWRRGFTAFLWADTSERTMATAQALSAGLEDGGVTTTVASLARGPDPLFHPFEAHCGVPNPSRLDGIAKKITDDSKSWIESKFANQFEQLYFVLACTTSDKCTPLKNVTDSAQRCVKPPTPPPGCSDPITWQGQFPYANTASETFLLEYANQMPVGWGRVLGEPPAGTEKLLSMMKLHDFYFDQTQRETYLAKIAAFNLAREISQTLIGDNAPCRRIPAGYQFAGFVGHDTEIASVASLLGLSWQFTTAPVGTRGLPDNDPLPAGALVFELWKEGTQSFVRIWYAAQGLHEMRQSDGKSCPAFRVPVRCANSKPGSDTCTLPLNTLIDAVGEDFLSRCEHGQQVCP